jgi:hypothetical protein
MASLRGTRERNKVNNLKLLVFGLVLMWTGLIVGHLTQEDHDFSAVLWGVGLLLIVLYICNPPNNQPPASQPEWEVIFERKWNNNAVPRNESDKELSAAMFYEGWIAHDRHQPKPPEPTILERLKELVKEWNKEFNDTNWNGLYRNALAYCITGLEKVVNERGDEKCAIQPTVAAKYAQSLMGSQAAEVTKAASSPKPPPIPQDVSELIKDLMFEMGLEYIPEVKFSNCIKRITDRDQQLRDASAKERAEVARVLELIHTCIEQRSYRDPYFMRAHDAITTLLNQLKGETR